jgi:hypothetical protein
MLQPVIDLGMNEIELSLDRCTLLSITQIIHENHGKVYEHRVSKFIFCVSSEWLAKTRWKNALQKRMQTLTEHPFSEAGIIIICVVYDQTEDGHDGFFWISTEECFDNMCR